ncbi:hypothetical protein [Microbacterium excoecariae]|uniref:hypothetical protein n=1 Tax=Microbacterium excoecariae TaxID=2715210 RepID=UPI0014076908|nr:hypothetical protein [Microbacterium excoecariae]NHI16045.1 hypothetical protein [Microbacterium excoecariae]
MSLEVTDGAVVAVDPAELRFLAQRVRALAETAREAAGSAARAGAQAALAGGPGLARPDTAHAWAAEAEVLATGLAQAADAYEIVELRTAVAMGGSGAAAADRELSALEAANPQAAAQADHLWAAWRALAGDALVEHMSDAGPAGARAATTLLAVLAAGRVALGMGRGSLGEPARAERRRREGGGPRGLVPMTFRRGPGHAPAGLAEAVARIPNSEGIFRFDMNERVLVERYTMPEAPDRYAVYIAGSSEMPWDDTDPFSWGNNLGLYLGEPGGEGYDFVVAALEEAGAEPGDVVDAVGFSQGAMIAQRLATDSAFDVQRVTTVGSPLHIPVGDAVALTIAHEDDPVAALADGGSPAALGGDGSALVRRPFAEEDLGLLEWSIPAHRVSAYASTAWAFEHSGDPRAGDAAAYYASLGEADRVERFIFVAPEDPPGRRLGGPAERGGATGGASAGAAG